MQVRICSLLVFLVAMPAFCQVEPSAEGGATAPEVEIPMATPPLVSGVPYPSVVGVDVSSNFFAVALTANAGYTNNIFLSATGMPVDDYTYLISPTFTYDRITPTQHTAFAYNPAFSFYQPDSVLDSIDQTANFRFEEHLSPHLAFSVTDFFTRFSDVFNTAFPYAGGVGGTTQPPSPAVLIPFAQQTANTGGAAITYQFGTNSMVGANGAYSLYDFGNTDLPEGLDNSTGESASAFYIERFARNQYIGLDYLYSRTVATPLNSQVDTQTETLMPYYSIYFKGNFSVSVSFGAQNTHATQTSQPTSDFYLWTPAAVASMGWQTPRANLAVTFLRVITAGQGLAGPYQSSNINASGAWKISRTWHTGAAAGYNTIDPALTLVGQVYQGGNYFLAGVTFGRTFGDRFTADLGYDRLQESFSGIQAIAGNPDSDREYVNFTYQFKKPLGR